MSWQARSSHVPKVGAANTGGYAENFDSHAANRRATVFQTGSLCTSQTHQREHTLLCTSLTPEASRTAILSNHGLPHTQ